MFAGIASSKAPNSLIGFKGVISHFSWRWLEFVPKFLARRAKATKALASKPTAKPTGTAARETTLESSSDRIPRLPGGSSDAASTSRQIPPAISALPGAFHKRYLMNFIVLSPEQQRAIRESEQTGREHRARDNRAGWREHGAERRWGDVSGNNLGEAAFFRELSRQGLLEREEVKAMLRTGPLQDFRGSVLQAFIDFRMRKSLAKVVKIRRDRAALPITAYQDAIVNAVAANPCVLVAGDTGCGKSTQVPQFLLQAGYGRVACTQPRRISAMGLCRRVSYETLHSHGSQVAYQVRFDSSRRKSSRILFLTEGLLLRQIASDPDLAAYSVVIVDEVHERHAGCDFLLGLLRAVLRRRADLKVVLMSATINPELFSRFFDGAPLIRVPGRMHAVEVRYVPTAGDDDIQEAVSKHDGEGQRKLRSRRVGVGEGGKRVVFDARPYVKLLESIDATTPRDERGDLLVFLSGMSDMLAVSEGVREYVEAKNPRRWVVLMLHSSLSVEDQDKVFDAAPLGTRKMILATNIAETSVTIDGIRFVADSGKVKEMSWDPASGVRSLQEFWVSRASAEQRKGRAGRTGPGVCFRLYARDTFDRLSPFAEPEIRRCPLEGLVLQMKSLGLVDPRYFPYLSPPPPENLTAALETLALLGATATADGSLSAPRSVGKGDLVDGAAKTQDSAAAFADAIARAPLTPLGRVLSSLPVEPSVGKMLALASLFGESEHVLTLAAALSTQTPFDARASAASAPGANPVAEFASPDGDPFTVMNAYDEWIRVKAARRESSRRWCKRRGLQEQRLYEITKLRRQFEDLLSDSGLLWLGAAAKRARRRGYASRGQGRGAGTAASRGAVVSKEKLRTMKMRREGGKRRVLRVEVDVEDVGAGDPTDGAREEAEAKTEAEEAERDLRAEVGERVADDADDGLDLSSLEFYMAQDVDQLAESSARSLTRRDVSVIKAILCQGLYPNFAVADAGNAGRPSNERQYVTRSSGGLFMSPSSVLACQDFGVAAAVGGVGSGRGGGSGMSEPTDATSSRAATRAGRGDGLLCYGSVMETQRPFLSSVTPLPALQALLLFSARIDTSEDASLMLFDHWLLVEMRGGEPALIGQKLLAVACGLRARLKVLLSGALEEAERRRGAGCVFRVSEGHSGFAKQPRSLEDNHRGDISQDLPPLLIAAKRAWLNGVKFGERENAGHRAEQERVVDWAQVAEDLSVELADFMMQPIGYDVKAVTPRQAETLVIDAVRLGDPAELQRILHGSRVGNQSEDERVAEGNRVVVGANGGGLARRTRDGTDGEDSLELLAALSRAVEEEVRGTKGLFGLETGVLECLKRGVRLTPFLRHGSLRQRDPDAATPRGLAAGGLKKWWRCPRCHLSQVVDLEAIHEHFKVCLVDTGPYVSGHGTNGPRSNRPSDEREEKPKRRRMLGTSVKTDRSRNLKAE